MSLEGLTAVEHFDFKPCYPCFFLKHILYNSMTIKGFKLYLNIPNCNKVVKIANFKQTNNII